MCQILTGHCQDGVFFSAKKIQELLSASYYHLKEQHLPKTVACNTMSYNSSAKKARIRQKIKMHIYKYSIVFLNTYPRSFQEDWLQKRVMAVPKTCRNYRVLYNISWLLQNEPLILERVWWDLLCLHIWRQEVSNAEEVESNDSQRKRLRDRQ